MVKIGNQVRFLSKYFLQKDQQLVHGAEVYAGYLSDKGFVEEIEAKGMARDFFTTQFTEDAIAKTFPLEKEKLFKEFKKMLLFDALVGNNDRHFYNWGIVRHLKGAHHPYFAPIYDTARGLFWNGYEKKVISLYRNLNEKEISKYINNSKPKVGWEGNENLNHFQLAKFFVDKSNVEDKKEFANLLNDKKFGRCLELIEKEFSQLVSKERMKVIIFCLRQRYSDLLELFN